MIILEVIGYLHGLQSRVGGKSKIVEVDDVVKLRKEHKDYEKWGKYTFRVITVRLGEGKLVRIVRNFLNENMGSTNHYYNEKPETLDIIRKNKRYLKEAERRSMFNSATF